MFSLARILPREDKFYRMIELLAASAQTGARQLKILVESKDEAGRAAARTVIHDCKAKAKTVSAEVTRELCLTFITPFDREDISDFTSHLYKITKTIDKVHEYIVLHGLSATDDLVAQADIIVQESDAMHGMVQALIHSGKTEVIMKQAALLDELEGRGDDIRGALMAKLLKDTKDARELIIKKDLYDLLERVIDRYRNAAEVALQIALKHA